MCDFAIQSRRYRDPMAGRGCTKVSGEGPTVALFSSWESGGKRGGGGRQQPFRFVAGKYSIFLANGKGKLFLSFDATTTTGRW